MESIFNSMNCQVIAMIMLAPLSLECQTRWAQGAPTSPNPRENPKAVGKADHKLSGGVRGEY